MWTGYSLWPVLLFPQATQTRLSGLQSGIFYLSVFRGVIQGKYCVQCAGHSHSLRDISGSSNHHRRQSCPLKTCASVQTVRGHSGQVPVITTMSTSSASICFAQCGPESRRISKRSWTDYLQMRSDYLRRHQLRHLQPFLLTGRLDRQH